MTNLEFIDNEIEKLEQCLMIVKANSTLKYKLKYLKQIKEELEAWKICQRKMFIITNEYKNLIQGNTWHTYSLSSKELNNEEVKILKKALE